MMRDPFDIMMAGQIRGSGSTAILPLPASPSQNRLLGRDATTQNLYEQGYKSNSILRTCVDKMMLGISQPPLLVYDQKTKQEDVNSPLVDILTFPNPFFSLKILLQITMAYIAIGGDAYWYKVRDGYGQIIGFYPYHASQIQPVSSQYTWIEYFQYNNGAGYTEHIPIEDIIHFRWHSADFVRPFKALPPLLALTKELDIDNESLAGQLAMILNGFMPSMAISTPADTRLQMKELYAKAEGLQERFSGMNRGKLIVLNGGVTIQKLGMSLKDMGGADAISKIPESRIPAVFGIPITISGMYVGIEHSTYSNNETDKRKMAEDCLSPNWDTIEEAINHGIRNEKFAGTKGKSYYVAFDRSKVPALTDNYDTMLKQINLLFEKGIITRNEARIKLGEEEVPPDQDGFIFDLSQTNVRQPSIVE